MQVTTHLAIDRRLCGQPLDLSPGRCTVEILLTADMRADERDLVHGGFIFGAADHAAMLAVNEPTVVLASAEVRFLRPSRVGQTLRFEAREEVTDGRKRRVEVTGRDTNGDTVFSGSFNCFVPAQHVLGPP